MGMRVKDNTVQIGALLPAMYFALRVAEDVYQRHGVDDMVITSGKDGKHSASSLHYSGAAVDLRTNNVPEEKRKPVAEAIKHRLGLDFDVIFEGDHIHMELQPKYRGAV